MQLPPPPSVSGDFCAEPNCSKQFESRQYSADVDVKAIEQPRFTQRLGFLKELPFKKVKARVNAPTF